MGSGLAGVFVKEFHTAQTTTIWITAANIAPITFVNVPLKSSCADLHTRGTLDAIGDYTRPHTPFKGSVPLITRPTRLPRATTHLGFLSRTLTRRNFESRTSTRLIPLVDVIADVIHVSPRCAVADITCLRQPLTSSFDSRGLTVNYDQAVDFGR